MAYLHLIQIYIYIYWVYEGAGEDVTHELLYLFSVINEIRIFKRKQNVCYEMVPLCDGAAVMIPSNEMLSRVK